MNLINLTCWVKLSNLNFNIIYISVEYEFVDKLY